MTREEWKLILIRAKKLAKAKTDFPYELSVFGGKVPITTKLVKSIIIKED